MRKLRLRLRPLSEAEAYARCHGRRESEVRIVHLEPRRPRYELRVTGEDLRRSFEERLDAREPHEPTTGAGDATGEPPTPTRAEQPGAPAGMGAPGGNREASPTLLEVAAADGLAEHLALEAEAAAPARRG